jgi:sRNA-binding protein
MAKDRNTYAKRQRETERKRQADEKRLRRMKKKQSSSGPTGTERAAAPEQRPEPTVDSRSTLSSTQQAVLTVFRRFRMTPGQMLCFSRADAEVFRTPLAELTEDGLLVTERFSGGYSLTPTGFAAMQAIP